VGRVPEISLTRIRWYSDGFHYEVPPKLVSLAEFCSKYPNKIVDRNIFNILLTPQMFLLAYHKLRSKPGNMTPGLYPDTLDGIDANCIDDVVSKLKAESFNFSPARRILIPKANGKLRPLTIASPRDKLVQEVMRMILEAIFEPTFLECSHGFRPNKGCHSALKYVDESFKSSAWIIEGDIKGCFDNFDHDVLMNTLRNKITDLKFLNLVKKALTVGYVQPGIIAPYNIIGTPQGSTISPILCNIYMHELDKFVLSLKADFDVGSRAAINPTYHRLSTAATRAKQKGDPRYLELARQLRNLPYTLFNDGSYKRLAYCRYAYDWIIGVRGPLADSEQTLTKVTDFLKSTLKLDVSPDKTKITCLNKDKALFLGALISISHPEVIKRSSRLFFPSTDSKAVPSLPLRAGRILRLEAPINRIRDKLTASGFISNSRPNPKNIWIALEKDQIISLYNSVLRGYINYYRFAANYSNMVSFVRWVIYFSCARTLAAKFNSSVAKLVKKFGKDFRGDSKIGLFNPSYSGYSGAKRFATKELEANSSIKALYARS
jgi:group II intron reverse transcriptase/maturase